MHGAGLIDRPDNLGVISDSGDRPDLCILWMRLFQRSGLPTPRKGLVTQALRGFSAPSPDGHPDAPVKLGKT